MLESQGNHGNKYEKIFEYEYLLEDFLEVSWQKVGENWIAKEEYDCLYFDHTRELGYALFEYYFYPDFTAMGTEKAMAVIVGGGVGVGEGEIYNLTLEAFPMTRGEYEQRKASKEESKEKILVIEKGELLLGKEEVNIPFPSYRLECIPIKDYKVKELKIPYKRKREKILWGYRDTAEAAKYVAKKFYEDVREKKISNGEAYGFMTEEAAKWPLILIENWEEEGWEMDEAYDCYYVKTNEVAETLHLQYYFYPKNLSEKEIYEKVLVIDVYLSKKGKYGIKYNQNKRNPSIVRENKGESF